MATTGERVFEPDYRIQWFRVIPFLALHAACFAVLLVGVSWTAAGICAGLYLLRMFAITGFYHRYFSHKCFKTSRAFQFVMAVLGSTAVQRGPIWWAAHHRHHHAHTDEPEDLHSPAQRGFFMAHVGWFLTKLGYRVNRKYSKDWERFPELRFLDRFDFLVPALFAAAVYGLGVLIERRAPGLGAGRWQVFVFGFVVSTVLLYHGTFAINSLAHLWGRRRYDTPDTSRNNALLALITLGEGWHNNHHHCSAARQGFFWWEFDPTYLVLRFLAFLRIVRDLKPVPERLRRPGGRP